jgi:hypothetical protein
MVIIVLWNVRMLKGASSIRSYQSAVYIIPRCFELFWINPKTGWGFCLRVMLLLWPWWHERKTNRWEVIRSHDDIYFHMNCHLSTLWRWNKSPTNQSVWGPKDGLHHYGTSWRSTQTASFKEVSHADGVLPSAVNMPSWLLVLKQCVTTKDYGMPLLRARLQICTSLELSKGM